MYSHFKLHMDAHGNFLIFCQMDLHPNINFLISNQNKAQKINPKMLKQ